ncbi:hypothetical protein [Rhizobium sp. EC-SD404]|uniref:hypothetical protein n=1 Tax=Rhizobium sp. EC-SD404 TaxID=2038389 RepID=UPI0012554243|nr:hypothetical protein [Rhizobium sp. EC-SD404]VVT31402.1 hypothetical protein RHIZ404_230286 [Rhizobium sp. EC-SD404]
MTDDLIDQFSDEFDIFSVVDGRNSQERRRQKQLRFRLFRLQLYLERGNWSLNEAAHILSGLDPEFPVDNATREDGIELRCLPGLDMPQGEQRLIDFYSERKDAVEKAKARLSTINDLSTLSVATLISKAKAAGLKPHWLETAEHDPELSSYLPEMTPDKPEEPPHKDPREIARLGGVARYERTVHELIPFIDNFLERRIATGDISKFCFKSGKLSPRKIANSIAECQDLPINPYKKNMFTVETIEKTVSKSSFYKNLVEMSKK